jgi:antitoxin component YwqK of YwqJK toxin-antitoxin module
MKRWPHVIMLVLIGTVGLATCKDDAQSPSARASRDSVADRAGALAAEDDRSPGDPGGRMGRGPGAEQSGDQGDCPEATVRRSRTLGPGREEFCVQVLDEGPPVRHGPYRRWTKDDVLVLEGRYADGKREGQWTEYYESGREKRSSTYRDDVFDGPWRSWYESGQPKGEGSYRGGQKHGRAVFWHENGQQKAENSYVDDQREGWSKNWYPNGQLSSEGSYVDGKKQGPWTDYTEDGQPVPSHFEDGVRVAEP